MDYGVLFNHVEYFLFSYHMSFTQSVIAEKVWKLIKSTYHKKYQVIINERINILICQFNLQIFF